MSSEASKDSVVIAGVVEMVGNHPFEYLILRRDDGGAVKITSPDSISILLRNMQGRKISARCSPVVFKNGEYEADIKEFHLLSH